MTLIEQCRLEDVDIESANYVVIEDSCLEAFYRNIIEGMPTNNNILAHLKDGGGVSFYVQIDNGFVTLYQSGIKIIDKRD